jgi:hypothetical protein
MGLLDNKATLIKTKMAGNMATPQDIKWLTNYEKKKNQNKNKNNK